MQAAVPANRDDLCICRREELQRTAAVDVVANPLRFVGYISISIHVQQQERYRKGCLDPVTHRIEWMVVDDGKRSRLCYAIGIGAWPGIEK
ncbi:hypothetical protein QE152_g39359 [Popillia japonica]|uniref:Uncharacterized protein n=1 Tax=Popillia japonica TaxID=7064 RepID=A0AAW1HU50_POPJA